MKISNIEISYVGLPVSTKINDLSSYVVPNCNSGTLQITFDFSDGIGLSYNDTEYIAVYIVCDGVDVLTDNMMGYYPYAALWYTNDATILSTQKKFSVSIPLSHLLGRLKGTLKLRVEQKAKSSYSGSMPLDENRIYSEMSQNSAELKRLQEMYYYDSNLISSACLIHIYQDGKWKFTQISSVT